MATYNQISYGSTGDDVKKLQELLNASGNYNLDVDGNFGPKTQSAVKDYQKQNNLAVDGIVGKNTWGALTAASNTTPTTNTAQQPEASTPTTGGFTYDDFNYESFAPSDIVNQANTLIQQHQSNKPGSYTPVWQDEADAYLKQYQERGPFTYDFNSDALYNQYKDNYIRQGQMAMMDTMGQAAALTGGYGNSYAQSVGQQAYQQQLSQLNDKLPELWQMANDRYTQEGQEMLAMYDLYSNREAQAYNQYQDGVDSWYREMDRLTDNYNTLYDREYGEYRDKQNIAYDEYTSDKDRAWDEYLTNMDKEQTAAELLASAGSYDRLKEIYGLTDEEVAAIKAANTPKATGGGSSNNDKKYSKWSTEADNYWTTLLNKADSLPAVQAIGDRMQGVGYDPSFIATVVGPYEDKYYNGNAQPTGVPISPTVTMQAIRDANKVGTLSGNMMSNLDKFVRLTK